MLTFAAGGCAFLLAGPGWDFAQRWIAWHSFREPSANTLLLWRTSYVFVGTGFMALAIVEIALVIAHGTPLL